jgi:hypothetical protein
MQKFWDPVNKAEAMEYIQKLQSHKARAFLSFYLNIAIVYYFAELVNGDKLPLETPFDLLLFTRIQEAFLGQCEQMEQLLQETPGRGGDESNSHAEGEAPLLHVMEAKAYIEAANSLLDLDPIPQSTLRLLLSLYLATAVRYLSTGDSLGRCDLLTLVRIQHKLFKSRGMVLAFLSNETETDVEIYDRFGVF